MALTGYITNIMRKEGQSRFNYFMVNYLWRILAFAITTASVYAIIRYAIDGTIL